MEENVSPCAILCSLSPADAVTVGAVGVLATVVPEVDPDVPAGGVCVPAGPEPAAPPGVTPQSILSCGVPTAVRAPCPEVPPAVLALAGSENGSLPLLVAMSDSGITPLF